MAIEIELKAWVDDAEAVRKRLCAIGAYEGRYDKDDEYWRSRSGTALGSGVRIRRLKTAGEDGEERTAAVITFKKKEVRDGIEVNDEREFEVSDAEAFAELLSRLGLAPWIRKRKIGESWSIDGITAELSEIVGLGKFVELEILSDTDAAEVVASARKRLSDALSTLGVGEDRVEARYYTEMISALGNRQIT